MYVFMRGHSIAATNWAAASSRPRSRRNAASSLRNSTGNPATAGVSFNCTSNARVDSKPSFTAPDVATSTPGNPTLAARRANSGHRTRSATSVLFNDRYMSNLVQSVIPGFLNPRAFGATQRFHSHQLRVGPGEFVKMRDHFVHRPGDVFHVLLFPKQEKLRQPHGFLIRRALRHRAATVIIIDRLSAAKVQLRKVFRIHPEKIAAIHGLVKPPIAGDAFAVERRHKQIA